MAPDYPGFGLSGHPPGYGYAAREHAEVVGELVRHLKLENLTVMGQDWGGPIGMRVVLDHYRGPFPDPGSRRGVAEFPREITRAREWLDGIAGAVPGRLGHLPLFLTWGTGDLAFTPGFMDRFRRDFRTVTVVPLDARHFIQEEVPGEISRAMEEFLEALPGGASVGPPGA